MLAIEKAFFANNRNASLLNVLVDEIRAIGRRRKLTVIMYAPSTVKKFVCGNGHASKKEVAGAWLPSTPSSVSILPRTENGRRGITRTCSMRWPWA